LLQGELARNATPDLASAIAELSIAMGDTTASEQYYKMAEQIERAAWGSGAKQPQVLARILSERPGRSAEAVALAEEAARSRADIYTMDALAWAYFKNGQADAAAKAMQQALRTGTRDRRIRCHAEEIASAPLRLGGVISGRAPASTRRCLEWHP
jgi:hypothetical protein